MEYARTGLGLEGPRFTVSEGTRRVMQGGSNSAAGVRASDILAGTNRVEKVLGIGTSAAAKYDPPHYFDANGNRMFNKECL
jgi:hypothetical protein